MRFCGLVLQNRLVTRKMNHVSNEIEIVHLNQNQHLCDSDQKERLNQQKKGRENPLYNSLNLKLGTIAGGKSSFRGAGHS